MYDIKSKKLKSEQWGVMRWGKGRSRGGYVVYRMMVAVFGGKCSCIYDA